VGVTGAPDRVEVEARMAAIYPVPPS